MQHSKTDKGYDSKSIVKFAAKNGMNAVIISRSNAKISRIYDKELYKKRHIVENLFLQISVHQKYLVLPSLPLHRIHHALLQSHLSTASSCYSKVMDMISTSLLLLFNDERTHLTLGDQLNTLRQIVEMGSSPPV